MVRTIIIVTVASLVLAIATLTAAAALVSRDVAVNGWVWPEKLRNVGIHVNGPSPGARTPDEVRDIAWQGSDTLQVDLQADVTYVQGAQPGIHLEGPADLLPFIEIENGRLFLKPESDKLSLGRFDDLEITVVAPSVRRFVVNGSPKLKVANYDQENLSVEINGSGEVGVEGRTDRLAVTISGSGEANLENVQVTDANVKVVGSGETRLAPTGTVQVAIAGSGDVYLLSKPTSLTSQVEGSGELHAAN